MLCPSLYPSAVTGDFSAEPTINLRTSQTYSSSKKSRTPPVSDRR